MVASFEKCKARCGNAFAIALSYSRVDDFDSSSTRVNNYFKPFVSDETYPAKLAHKMTAAF